MLELQPLLLVADSGPRRGFLRSGQDTLPRLWELSRSRPAARLSSWVEAVPGGGERGSRLFASAVSRLPGTGDLLPSWVWVISTVSFNP